MKKIVFTAVVFVLGASLKIPPIPILRIGIIQSRFIGNRNISISLIINLLAYKYTAFS